MSLLVGARNFDRLFLSAVFEEDVDGLLFAFARTAWQKDGVVGMHVILTIVAASAQPGNLMHPPLLPFIAFFLMAAVFFGLVQLFCHYLYDVRLGAAAVEIVMFKRFVVFSIPYEEITAVETVSFVEAVFSFSLGLVNRPFGGLLLIHRKRGLNRRVLVSPSRSAEFRDEVLARARQRLAET